VNPRLVVYTCDQGTPEWYAARAGIPTASEFATVMAKGRGNETSVTRAKYMRSLVGDRLAGTAEPEVYTNAFMERGKLLESEARILYQIITANIATQVGFLRRTDLDAGASPDSLVGNDGGLEIKVAIRHIQIERLLLQRCPPEHVAQVQGHNWIGEREWTDFMSYSPGLPPLIHRVYRDEAYIANLAREVAQFNDELQAMLAKVEELTS
jgi:hypothetical protein